MVHNSRKRRGFEFVKGKTPPLLFKAKLPNLFQFCLLTLVNQQIFLDTYLWSIGLLGTRSKLDRLSPYFYGDCKLMKDIYIYTHT